MLYGKLTQCTVCHILWKLVNNCRNYCHMNKGGRCFSNHSLYVYVHMYLHVLLFSVSVVRNFGMGDTKIQMESKSTKHQKSAFTMRVSKHEATVRFNDFLLLFHHQQPSLIATATPFGTSLLQRSTLLPSLQTFWIRTYFHTYHQAPYSLIFCILFLSEFVCYLILLVFYR